MNKPLAALGGLAATASVATPAILLTGGGSGSSGENQNQTTNEPIPKSNWNKSIPELTSAKDIRKLHQQINCLKKYNDLEDEIRTTGSLFFNKSFEANTTTGCLTVEYKKQTYENNKWSGEFKLVWVLENGEEGIMTSFHAKTHNGHLSVNSAGYFIGLGESEKWKVKQVKEKANENVTSESELSGKLPKPGSAISSEYQNYWGFNPNFTNICGTGECTKTQSPEETSSVTWNWKPSNDSSRKPDDWSESFETWFKGFLQEELAYKFQDLRGTWVPENN